MNLVDLLSLQRATDSTLLVEDAGAVYRVATRHPTFGLIETTVDKNDTTTTGLLLATEPIWNKAVPIEEFRFTTHDFTSPASWDGRTNGDPTASWAAANNGVTYDDVAYQWLDANSDPVCYLVHTETGVGSVWKKSSDDSIIVSFNTSTQHWERTDTNANVTSSRWSIVPYPNTKMQIAMANVIFGADAAIQGNGTLRYIVYMNYPPYGVIPVKQFIYPSAYLMKLSADSHKDIGQDVFATYDYRTTTQPIIDSLAQMRMDIVLDNNLPVTSATNRPAQGVFIGKKIVSF